eukprot:9417365-Lingulodinium_polyedra.AAC.1
MSGMRNGMTTWVPGTIGLRPRKILQCSTPEYPRGDVHPNPRAVAADMGLCRKSWSTTGEWRDVWELLLN